jgi:nitrate/nitrite transporter NarK
VRSQGGSPFAQGLYGGIAIGGGGVALAVVPLVEGWIGWRAPFASAVIIAAGAAGLLLLGPPDSAGARPKRAGGGGVLDVFRDGRLLRICLVYTTSFGLTVVLGNWVVSLLTRAGDYREETAGAIGSLLLLGGVLSRPLGGALARRYPGHVRLAVAVCFAASVVGTGMLAVAGPVALSVLGSLVVGIAAGIPFAASFAAATRIRPEAPAEASAVVNMSANVLIVIATPLFGLAFSLPGEGRIGFAVAAGLWAAAALVTPAVRELESGGPGPDRRT